MRGSALLLSDRPLVEGLLPCLLSCPRPSAAADNAAVSHCPLASPVWHAVCTTDVVYYEPFSAALHDSCVAIPCYLHDIFVIGSPSIPYCGRDNAHHGRAGRGRQCAIALATGSSTRRA